MKDNLDLREPPHQFNRGASDSSPDIDDRCFLTVFLPIIVVDQRPVLNALSSHHSLVDAVAGKSRFGSFEPFPDRHTVFEFEWAFPFGSEFDAFYDVGSGFVCIISPKQAKFRQDYPVDCGNMDEPITNDTPQVLLARREEDG